MNSVETLSAKRDKTAKRDAIVMIAKDIFLREGYSATSMATVAARVGGSKATLYNYFASKEELFEAVVGEFCERNAAVFGSLDWEGGDFATALTRFGGDITRLMLSDDLIAMHRLIAAEAGRFPEIGEAYHEAGVQRGKETLVARFKAALAAGHIRGADPRIAAQHFFELCVSGLHRRRLWNIGAKPSEAEIDDAVKVAVQAFLHGYAAR
jgi:TetR/AcrR family transcriptional regulator, mexJK operon transcriptional repressor